jgi:iron complex outermembrane receptor protein
MTGAAALLSIGVWSALAAPALAQTASDEIVVTGSYIRGTPEDAALPVDVITAQELADRGSPDVLDIIRAMPAIGPILGESNQFSGAAQGVLGTGNVNLRGLGGIRTLVLMNGRRTTITAAEGPGGVDTNLLPVAAFGRVEVLKDGAAATYGSDAIAGVVNFITRRDVDGLELAGDYRAIDGSDGDYSASANWGWVGDSSNIFVSLAHQHRSELSVLERDWAFRQYDVNPSGWSGFGNPGSFTPRNAGGTNLLPAGVNQVRDANCTAVGGYLVVSAASPACRFSFVPFDNLVEMTNRYQAYGEINVDMTPSMGLHLEGLYAKTHIPDIRFSPAYPPTSGPTGPGSRFSVTSAGPTPFANNPGALTAMQQAGLDPSIINATSIITLPSWRPLGNGGNSSTGGLGGQSGVREYEIFRLSAALTGEFDFGVGYDLAITYSDTQHDRATSDILIDRLQRALDGLGGPNCNGIPYGTAGSTCQFYNPFSNGYANNPALGLTNPGFTPANANDRSLIAWLFDKPTNTHQQNLTVVDVVFNGEIPGVTLPGGEIGWAAGAQWRRTEFQSRTSNELSDSRITPCPVPGTTTCAFATGPYIFLGQFYPQVLDETVGAVFAEFAAPIFDTLDVQLAVRHEDYGGLTGSTTNPKLSARWQATDFLALRGSVGSTFRGPTPLNRAARGITGLQSVQAAGFNFKSIDFFGNPALRPEKADTYSIGAIFELGGFRAIVDYWNYKFEDQITSVPQFFITNAVGQGQSSGTLPVDCSHPLRHLITFTNNNTCTQGTTLGIDIQRVRSDLTNGAPVETDGLDVSLTYDFGDVWSGQLTAGFDGSYVLTYEQDAFRFGGVPISPKYDAVGFTNYDRFPGTIPQWRGLGYLNFTRGPANFRYEVQYIDGVTDNRASPTVNNSSGVATLITFGKELDAFISQNLHVNVELPWETTLSASIVNIADEEPSEARLEVSYDPFIGNPLGRTFEIGVRKKF